MIKKKKIPIPSRRIVNPIPIKIPVAMLNPHCLGQDIYFHANSVQKDFDSIKPSGV